MELHGVLSIFLSLSHLTLTNTLHKASTVRIPILRGRNRGLEKIIKLPMIEYLRRNRIRTQLPIAFHQGHPNEEEMTCPPRLEVQHLSLAFSVEWVMEDQSGAGQARWGCSLLISSFGLPSTRCITWDMFYCPSVPTGSFFFQLCCMWDLSSPTSDPTHVPSSGSTES